MLSNFAISLAVCLALATMLAAGFFSSVLSAAVRRRSVMVQALLPAMLSIPYLLVSCSLHIFRWQWLFLYALLPVAVAAILLDARRVDAEQRGTWRDFLVLALLGLAVDLRWFEHAWPSRLTFLNKLLLLDAGIYDFLLLRQLSGTGFDLRLRLRDFGIGLREFALYTPIAISFGLALGFLHWHAHWPHPAQIVQAFLFTFFFIAIPEELFFRGWLQNLLERLLGRTPALFVTAGIFGLAHFNKRAAHFNWRYVLLAALAGIFYGRAWRNDRRVGTSAITHTCVDTVWSIWLR